MSKSIAAVLAYNQPELAQAMFDQLGKEMFLIDNGSEPPLNLPVDISLRLSSNRYFTGGWNEAMKALYVMGYEWVWMLNSDLLGTSQYRRAELEIIAEGLGEDCAVVSPSYNSPHSHMHSQGSYGIRQIPWADWACAFVSMKWWNKVGGFDTRFVGYGCEISWCKRAAEMGAKFYLADHEKPITHLGGLTAYHEGVSEHVDMEHANRVIQEIHGVPSWSALF